MRSKSIFLLSLAALFWLAGCVEPQEFVDLSKTDGSESVVTQFYFNIATGNEAATKQMARDVQRYGNFRGIDNATLFTFSLKNADSTTNDGQKITKAETVPTQMYNLSTILPKGSIDSTGGSRMVELTLPTGTNTLLFYAAALRETKTGTAGHNLDNDEVYGKLEYISAGDGRTTDLTVLGSRAAPRLNSSNKNQYRVMANIILGVLNHMLRIGFNATGTEAGAWDKTQVTAVYGNYNLSGLTLHWYDYLKSAAHNQDGAISPLLSTKTASTLETALGDLYQALTTIKTVEARAGSGNAVERQMGDLYSVLAESVASGAKNDEERVAVEMMQLIMNYIKDFFNYDASTHVATWKSCREVVAKLQNTYGLTNDKIFGSTGLTIEDIAGFNISEFPREFHIPFGGATLAMVQNGEAYSTYMYNDTIYLGAIYYNDKAYKQAFTVSVEDFTYTPELCYLCNAPIYTTESVTVVADFPNSVSSWVDPNAWSGTWTKDSHVESSTRAVALANNVHYGVAILQSQVAYETTTLKDNNKAIHAADGGNEDDKTITPSNTSYLEWTGILVAGQPDRVGWHYLAMPSNGAAGLAATKFSKMVYDKVNYVDDDTEGYVVPLSGNSSANYTMLFDNYNPFENTQNTVYVALEFRNRLGVDFWGNQNLIRDGGTFYIIGKLAPQTFADSWWTDAHTMCEMLPPYDDNGNTKRVPRVFMQNHVTTAEFKIGENSLKHAFATVPDLRSARLSVGLSVDLNWQTAAGYSVVLGD